MAYKKVKPLDLTGQRFGKLKVLVFLGIQNTQRLWKCLCDCGNLTDVITARLRKGVTKSCGCLSGNNQFAPLDLTGQRFGKLTVIHPARSSSWHRRWKCRCDCGNFTEVPTGNLRSGNSGSCGCVKGGLKHGMIDTPEYSVWKHMLRRCLNKNDESYCNYGGRGITVCGHWLHSFPNFFADMGTRPSPKLMLERIDNDKGYWCGHCGECVTNNRDANCKWANRAAQNRNHRRNQWVTYNGETLCIKDWANRLGVDNKTLSYRIKNWSIEEAFTTPVGQRRPIQ